MPYDSFQYTSKSLEKLTESSTEAKRSAMARNIYLKYGQSIPYQLEKGEYKIYEPTEGDMVKFQEGESTRHSIESIYDEMRIKSYELAIIQEIVALAFFILVPVTLFIEQKILQRKKIYNQTLNTDSLKLAG